MTTDVQTRSPNNSGHTDIPDRQPERGATTQAIVAGIGGIAFGVLTFVSLALTRAPGGDYKESHARDFVASGHRPAVFVSLYLIVLAAVGLICLFARLREAVVVRGRRPLTGTIFWAAGMAVAIALLFGQTINASVPIAYSVSSGGFSIAPTLIYALAQVGNSLVLGAGGILMGFTLLGLSVLARDALPTWLRWATLIAGVLGLASPMFFPFFALLIWACVAGIWLVASCGSLGGPMSPSAGEYTW